MMKPPVTLASLRTAIRNFSRARFDYDGAEVTADLYLLGCARKTGAYVVLAWCVEPDLGWQRFRFAMIRDFTVVGRMPAVRDDYDPNDPAIATIDTFVPVLRRRQGSP